MNLVGAGGKGESVWLAFFLIAVLKRFAPVARQRGDAAFAALCESEAKRLAERVEATSLGRRLVPARLVRRRHAARLDGQRASAASTRSRRAGRCSPARRRRSARARAMALAARAARARRRAPGAAARSAVRHLDAVARLHPGLRAGRARERRPVHPRGDVGDDGVRRARRRRPRLGAVRPARPDAATATAPAQIATYKVEPYVVAGDVYAFAPHTGRGGWTWYTGSAGWMYQLLVESLLGLDRRGNQLRLRPLLPRDWHGFEMRYRFGEAIYEITCRRAASASRRRSTLDGVAIGRRCPSPCSTTARRTRSSSSSGAEPGPRAA